MNKIIEAYILEDKFYMSTVDIENDYAVEIIGSRSKPKVFKDYSQANDYAVKFLKKARSVKTITPASAKKVIISQHGNILKTLTLDDITK